MAIYPDQVKLSMEDTPFLSQPSKGWKGPGFSVLGRDVMIAPLTEVTLGVARGSRDAGGLKESQNVRGPPRPKSPP